MLSIKYGAFVLLSLSSGYLSVNMFRSLGADLFAQILLIVIAISLETVKVFALLRIEYFLSTDVKLFKDQLSHFLRSSLIIYGLLAALSVLASFGFTLVTVDRQVEVARIDFAVSSVEVDFEVEQKKRSLETIEVQIENLQDQMRRINPDFATGSTRLSEEARILDERKNALVNEITTLLRQQSQATREINLSEQTNVYGMFYLMGRPVGLDERQVMFILLVLISILIEVGMIYTSPTIKIREEDMHEVAKISPPPAAKKKRPATQKKKKVSASTKVQTPNIVVAVGAPTVKTGLHEKVVPVRVKPKPVETPVRAPKQELPPAPISIDSVLQITAGNKLKSPADIAYTTGIGVEDLNNFFHTLSGVKDSSGKPLIYMKESNWHLNFLKQVVASNAKVKEALNVLKAK